MVQNIFHEFNSVHDTTSFRISFYQIKNDNGVTLYSSLDLSSPNFYNEIERFFDRKWGRRVRETMNRQNKRVVRKSHFNFQPLSCF